MIKLQLVRYNHLKTNLITQDYRGQSATVQLYVGKSTQAKTLTESQTVSTATTYWALCELDTRFELQQVIPSFPPFLRRTTQARSERPHNQADRCVDTPGTDKHKTEISQSQARCSLPERADLAEQFGWWWAPSVLPLPDFGQHI